MWQLKHKKFLYSRFDNDFIYMYNDGCGNETDRALFEEMLVLSSVKERFLIVL